MMILFEFLVKCLVQILRFRELYTVFFFYPTASHDDPIVRDILVKTRINQASEINHSAYELFQ